MKDTDTSQQADFIGKSTLNHWNDISSKPITRDKQINIRSLHVDPHSHLDTCSNDIETSSIIHFNPVKSTIDNWNEQVEQYLNLIDDSINVYFSFLARLIYRDHVHLQMNER